MPTNKSSKGNPAHHRMSNAHLKAKRAASWARGEQKKARNRAANEALHKERLANNGLGRRERRRLAAGIRQAA